MFRALTALVLLTATAGCVSSNLEMRAVMYFAKISAARCCHVMSAPGEEIAIEMTVAGLLATGQYGLRYDMVEGVT